MADASETPDWFGNVFNAYILEILGSIFNYLNYSLGYLLALLGSNDQIAGPFLGMVKDFLPPLAKEKWDATKEMNPPKAWYA